MSTPVIIGWSGMNASMSPPPPALLQTGLPQGAHSTHLAWIVWITPDGRRRSGTLHNVARHEIARMIGLSANIEKRYHPSVWCHGNPIAARQCRAKGGHHA